jgi:DNA-binding NtrC family response regulator
MGATAAVRSILVIEDDYLARQAETVFLEDCGYAVSTAKNGAEVQLLEGESFDMVLLDLGLPDIEGLELLRSIRARWPQSPVIVVTGSDDAQTAVKALKLGAADYLVKPVDIHELQRATSACSEKRERTPAIRWPVARYEQEEREAVRAALEAHGDDRKKMAEVLGISRRTLYRRLKRFGLLRKQRLD